MSARIVKPGDHAITAKARSGTRIRAKNHPETEDHAKDEASTVPITEKNPLAPHAHDPATELQWLVVWEEFDIGPPFRWTVSSPPRPLQCRCTLPQGPRFDLREIRLSCEDAIAP